MLLSCLLQTLSQSFSRTDFCDNSARARSGPEGPSWSEPLSDAEHRIHYAQKRQLFSESLCLKSWSARPPFGRKHASSLPFFCNNFTTQSGRQFWRGSPGGPRPDPRAARQVSCTNFTMPGWTTSSGTSDPKLPSPTRQSHFRLSLDSKTMQPAALNLLLHSGFSSQRHGFKARHTLAALDEKAVLAMSCILVHLCFVLPSFHHAFLHACMHSYIHDGRTDGQTDRHADKHA